MKRITILAAALLLCATAATAQTKGFELGKWTEIQNAILKELNRSYVDSLPIGRRDGISHAGAFRAPVRPGTILP